MDADRGKGKKENEREQILHISILHRDVPYVAALGGCGSGGGIRCGGGPNHQPGMAGFGLFLGLGPGFAAVSAAKIKNCKKHLFFVKRQLTFILPGAILKPVIK